MAKRYFIEIVGINPDAGIDQLVEAGIQPNRILVVDEDNPMAPVLDAILNVIGVTWAEITGNSRKHNVIVARIIYVYNAIKRGRNCLDICKEIGKNRSMIRWYESRYDESFKFDPSFRKMAQSIAEVIDSFAPKDQEQPKEGKKKKLTDAEIEAILDSRQLKIQW